MKEEKIKKVFNLILWVMVLLCVYITYKNYTLNEDNTEKSLEERIEWLELQEAASSHDISGLTVQDIKADSIFLSELAENGPRIGIYANRIQCSDCWKTVVQNMREICRSYQLEQPFLLAEGFTLLDMRIMEKQDSLNIPLYLLQSHDATFLKKLERKEKPFIFFLNPDATISSILFYEDAIVPMLTGYLKKRSPEHLSADSLIISKPVINLGGVPERRSFTLRYVISNHSDHDYKIVKVEPFCSCIAPEDNPTAIAAHKSVELTFSFVSDGLGSFDRKINIYTDQRKEPYTFHVVGYVQ